MKTILNWIRESLDIFTEIKIKIVYLQSKNKYISKRQN